VASLGVTLLPSGDSYELTERGTRHDSAAAFSAGYPFVLVFVVSSDGQVTVFKEGRVIVSTHSARRQFEESELCECVLDQLDGTEDEEERWDAAGLLAEPECPSCGGAGLRYVATHVREPLDEVL
jgi:hypothetical protein